LQHNQYFYQSLASFCNTTHFVALTDDPRSTPTLEVKWAVHEAGDSRTQWAMNIEATTLSILIKVRFRLQFPEQEVLLSQEGDYVL